ncbi:MAG: 4a-hydroxytetrahydrobiopterin dehydratase [Candidatus Staskawiczbacteria bacterium]|nr:4a-hydroxytetrahydrobiopterin dehydratase [Candidatus Staskawiczbacteria bacterium]
MTDLINKKCVPHEKIVKLGEEEIKGYFSQLKGGWALEDKKIKKQFKFEDFVKAMEFVNKIAVLAEEEGHHPDIAINYSKVEITLWTHFVKGLSENDFILAAKIDSILVK